MQHFYSLVLQCFEGKMIAFTDRIQSDPHKHLYNTLTVRFGYGHVLCVE